MTILPDTTDAVQLTAAQRGPEWGARYGCPDWCRMDHAGADGEPGWHQGRCAQILPPKAHLHPQEPDMVLSAVVTQVNQDADIFGLETRLWVDVNTETLELDVAETDRLIADLEQFLPLLRALREHLADASAGDFPADPEAKARYMAEHDAQVKARATEGRA